MGKTTDFQFVGSYNNQRIVTIDAERSINQFEYHDPLGKKPKSLISTSGLVDTGISFQGQDQGVRGQFTLLSYMYIVVGNGVYRLDSSNNVTLLGNLVNTNSGYVGIDANSFQIIFVDGVDGYIWDTLENKFTGITDTSFPSQPIDVCTLDGFFVVAAGNTPNFQLSMFNQGLIWGPAGPDPVTFDDTPANNWAILASADNYQTGVPIVFDQNPTAPDTVTFDDTVGNNWAILASTTNYPTGTPFLFNQDSPGGTLPTPLNDTDTYYAINVDSTHIRIASSLANATSGIPIVLTSNGTPTNTIGGALPKPLNNTDTYYAIYVDSTHIRIASSLSNAQAGLAIVLTTSGAPPNTIESLGQLQQGSISTHPGNIVACRTLHRRLFLFSEYFTEVWENAGLGTNLPFRRNNSLLMEYGCAAIGSVASDFDMMMFISQARNGLGSVMLVKGTEAMTASTQALDFALAQYYAKGQIADCRGFFIKESGIIFYRMNFTEANHTYCFNVSQSHPTTYSEELNDQYKYWHEEEVLNGDRHPAQTGASFNGINYVGDYKNPILYKLDVNTYQNNGEAIKRTRITRALCPPGYQRIRVDRLQFDLLQGQLVDGLDPGPQSVYLSISKDGGQTYGYQTHVPMGDVGQRNFRSVFRKLGTIPRGQPWIVKVEFYGNYPWECMGASWAFEELPE